MLHELTLTSEELRALVGHTAFIDSVLIADVNTRLRHIAIRDGVLAAPPQVLDRQSSRAVYDSSPSYRSAMRGAGRGGMLS